MSIVEVVYEGMGESWRVARVAQRRRETFVEYTEEHVARRVELAPVHHGHAERARRFTGRDPDHLPGLLADELPDAWGRLMLMRDMRRHGIEQPSPLQLLTWLGRRTMGALTFHPVDGPRHVDRRFVDLDRLQGEMLRQLAGSPADDHAADVLVRAAGSAPGGARPKIAVAWTPSGELLADDGEDLPAGSSPWLIKFHGPDDGSHHSTIEAIYLDLAAATGITVCDHRLLTAPSGTRFLSVRRFDRAAKPDQQPVRVHMASAAGLLERYPEYDQHLGYSDLIRLTRRLTGDIRQVTEMVRRAVFNVVAHNRDDHARNTAFLWTPEDGWSLAPAYDLTHSLGPRPRHRVDEPGEHYLDVSGKGAGITREDLRGLSRPAGLTSNAIDDMVDQALAVTTRWPDVATEYDLDVDVVSAIARRLPGLTGP